MTETLFFDSNNRSTSTPERSDEAAVEFEAVVQSDRNFFLAHPERDWYVRPISPIELSEGRSLGKSVGEDAMVLVGEIVPGSRVRLTFWGIELPPIEEFKKIQRQMRKEMGIKGRLKHPAKGRPKRKGFGQQN